MNTIDMNLSQPNKLIEEAVNEFARFKETVDIVELFKTKEALYEPSIPDPIKGGSVFCGKKAFSYIEALALHVVEKDGLERSIYKRDAIEESRRLFGKAIFDNSFVVEDGDDFVDKLSQKIASELRNFTIYIPCHVAHGCIEPETLQIGNLRLINRLYFKQITSGLGEDEEEDFLRKMWVDVLERYQRFFWFMEVPILGVYNLNLAKEIASVLAQHAINLMHLVISSSHSDKMMVGYDIPAELHNHLLYKTNNGDFSYEHSGGAKGNVGLPKKFTDIFESERPKELLNVLGHCLNLELDLKNDYPMVRRLLEATYWYGDAVRETNRSVKIVKFASALERLLIFGETRGYTQIIPKRAASLMKNVWAMPDDEIRKYMDTIKKGYDLRSKILHGSISPISPKIDFSVYHFEHVCSLTLEAFIHNLGSYLTDQQDEKVLRDWIKSLVLQFFPIKNKSDGA
ncbi:hypothetical protein [Neptunicella sp.]|uniref:hypothetical protein n=1 Tax=Neptunicella sp. TaxID=2125986 RepID=UPI003F694212